MSRSQRLKTFSMLWSTLSIRPSSNSAWRHCFLSNSMRASVSSVPFHIYWVSQVTKLPWRMFWNSLLMEALKKHPGNTLIKRERVSKRKSSEREELTMVWEAGNNCRMLRCTGGCRCLKLRHSGAGSGAKEECLSPSKWAVGVCKGHLRSPCSAGKGISPKGVPTFPWEHRGMSLGDIAGHQGQQFCCDILLCPRQWIHP